MELIVVFIGFLSIVVILLVLSTLHFFLGRTNDAQSSAIPPASTSQNRRRNARRRQRRAQRQQTNGHDEPSVDNKTDEEESVQDDDDEFQDTIGVEISSPPPPLSIDDEQRKKSKTIENNEVPLKPQASVAPVKQTDRPVEKKSNSSTTPSSKKKTKKPTNSTGESPSSRLKKDTQSESTEPRESSINNDYSSESDFVSESSPIVRHSFPTKPVGVETRRNQLEEFLSILDSNAFTSDQLEILLNHLTNRTRVHSNPFVDFFPSRKNDEILQCLFDEKNRNHLKTLAIELQSEKNRVLELSKTNGELEQTLRQLQQQQQHTPNESLVQCQQALGSYQMQLKRVTDENNQLMHQLHAYSMIPASINEVKQQYQILEEQIRQMSLRNSILEKEIADGERASKNAADIYRKADAQKQDRIEQMIADLAKYKKIDKEIRAFRQKNEDLEKNFQTKSDELRRECEELEERLALLTELSTSKSVVEEEEEDSANVEQRNCKFIEGSS